CIRDSYSTDPNIPCVLYDDQKAAYEATQLLIDRGHCDIGVIAGPTNSIHSANRILGYQEALYANKIPFNPKHIVYGNWERDIGYELSKELIQSGVTAIFAHNDLMAAGVIDYCTEHKIQVGKDLALIGFDNREIGTASRPKLSTVSLPLFDMGQTATQVLLNILAGKHIQRGQKVMLACTIIERESTMPASDSC
ncbi:MAG TPA: LacI family transcriptional regulator, partial [Ruminiclostridium sp.]|nr:LacI family transcriptional regulator [Ruminiclostridium sp.]